jgi:hypothetical protein
VLFELRLYVSLGRWLLRRPATGGPEEQPVGYAKAVTPVMWLWIFGSALEVPLVHVLIPWDAVRITVLALSVWGLLWMVGFLASLNVHPHLLGCEQVRLRNGPSTWVSVPWEAVESVAVRRTDLPSSMRTLQEEQTERGTALHVAVSGTTNVQATFKRPTTLHTSKGPRTVVALGFMADDPRDVVVRARELASSRSPR